MGTKKRPNTAPVAVNRGDVFATFLHEAQTIGREVVARREFTEQVTAFLKTKGLVEEFEAFRAPKSDKG